MTVMVPKRAASGAAEIDSMADGISKTKTGRTVQTASIVAPSADQPMWTPPDFGEYRRPRIGASIVEQFVVGHDAGDVLRELVQNEFDGGGNRLSVTYGSNALEVAGNGRGITRDGWTRLSVLVGTGRVVGGGDAERVAPKGNGIGSKNFGLRSLFLFGNEIYVRSNGSVAVLDLRTLETGRVRDDQWRGEKGVRLQVPFRDTQFEILEPFTAERERRAFEIIATGMFATLVKLALGGKNVGLREVTVRSARTGRTLSWRQDAAVERCRLHGVSVVARTGRLVDQLGDGRETRSTFHEVEFARQIDVPAQYADRKYPAYYRAPNGRLKIAIALPIHRRRINQSQTGNFYYPLQTPVSRTGCALSVSAPFDLNNDRSSLLNNSWNEWLIDAAAALTADLLKGDWFDRYGADAYKALIPNGQASPTRFAEEITRHLKQDACWPTRSTGDERFVTAAKLVIPSDPALDGFLGDAPYLDPSLSADRAVRELATRAGAHQFVLSSLVRLRCADQDAGSLQTKLKQNEANYHFPSYEVALKSPERQGMMAAALSGMTRMLNKFNKTDLSSTASTLSATGELRRATELIIVDADIWDACSEPLSNRLHPKLIPHEAIAGICRRFDEQVWIIDAAVRAATGRGDDDEREALYAKLLAGDVPISRRALSALRHSPVVKNQRGKWTAPADMVLLHGTLARFMAPVVDAPSREMLAASQLLARLRIRDKLNGTDLIRYGAAIHERPETADKFEMLLLDNIRLLSSAVIGQLRALPCLRALSGKLVPPPTLHLDTTTNRLCIGDLNRIVAGGNEVLYRKLGVREVPHSDTLLTALDAAREQSEPPTRPDLLYPALVAAIARERRSKADVADRPICWVNGGYHAPKSILVGPRIPLVLNHAIPVFKRSDEVAAAYVALGAHGQARDQHWRHFFRYIATEWGSSVPLDNNRRQALLGAYRQREWQGLPEGLDDVDCLVDRRGYLYSPTDIANGQLVDPDFPLLERAISEAGGDIGIVARSDKSRIFFSELGIRPLSSIAGRGKAVFGEEANRPLWFKPYHREVILSMLRKPIFGRALYEIAVGQRHNNPGFRLVDRSALETGLNAIGGVIFFNKIARQYDIAGMTLQVQADVAVGAGNIGMVAPKTKLDFQHLVAEALADVAGAANAAQTRGLALAFLPLVLCRSAEEIRVHLARVGIGHARWNLDDEQSFELDDDFAENVSEEALRQMMQNLSSGATEHGSSKTNQNVGSGSISRTSSWPTSSSAPPPPPPFVLPDLNEVQLTVAAPSGGQVEGQRTSKAEGGSYSSGWMPRTTTEIERDRDVGRRGEQLIYRMEIERIREMGYSNPEQIVVWTSLTNPGADHDIRSIDEDGKPKWMEVKSTTGIDGRFEWSHKEFEKALRERDGYELWRVYRAAERTPIAKCFRNPAELIAVSRLALELGTLRASIEDLH